MGKLPYRGGFVFTSSTRYTQKSRVESVAKVMVLERYGPGSPCALALRFVRGPFVRALRALAVTDY